MAGGRLGRAVAVAGIAGVGFVCLPGWTGAPAGSGAVSGAQAAGLGPAADAAIPRPAATTPTPAATPATGPGADTGAPPPPGSPGATGPTLGLDAGYPTDTGPCRPGSSPSLVVPTPATTTGHGGTGGTSGRTTTPRTSATRTPTGTIQCVPLRPQPFPAPPSAVADTVGGAGLAGTGLVVRAEAGIPAPPTLDAVSYLVADLDSGQILLAKGAHSRLRPASCLKTLTAATLIPLLPPDRQVVATADMVAANGTRIGMVAGTSYRVDDLMRALLVDSANDAAYGLAEAAGGYQATVGLLNAKAAALGAYDTVVVDPSGLDEPGQMSSAYDLALFARAGWQLPAFRDYVATRQANFPMPPPPSAPATKTTAKVPGRTPVTPNPPPTSFQYSNINAFLFGYPGAVGVKTGRTDRAKHTFVGAATRDGRTLLVVWMGALSADWHPTAALFDWSFTYASHLTPVGTLVAPGTAARPAPLPATAAPSPPPGRPSLLWLTEPRAGAIGAAGAGVPTGARSAADGMSPPWLVGGALVLLAVLAAGTVVGRRASRPVPVDGDEAAGAAGPGPEPADTAEAGPEPPDAHPLAEPQGRT